MRCQDITFQKHRVDIAGGPLPAETDGTLRLAPELPTKEGQRTYVFADRAFYHTVMNDPDHKFHPYPCTCNTPAS